MGFSREKNLKQKFARGNRAANPDMPAKRKRSGGAKAPTDGAEDTPLYKPHPCRDDMANYDAVNTAAKRLERLNSRISTDLHPNVSNVRLLNNSTAVTTLALQTAEPQQRLIIFADNETVLEMLQDVVEQTSRTVCSGACASRAEHDKDVKAHPDGLRWCPK